LSRPEIQFDFELPGFVREARSAQARKHGRAWKYLKYPVIAGGLAAVIITVPGLLDKTHQIEIFAGPVKQANRRDADDVKKTMADIKALLARLDEKTNTLADRVALIETNLYRSRAAALGFRNPSIWPISLDGAQQPQQFVFESKDKKPHHLALKILHHTKDAIVFEMSGSVENAEFKAAKITQPFKINAAIELTRGIETEGLRPIYMSLLEIPTKDTAILAVGLRE
jgi:hypothetical protein